MRLQQSLAIASRHDTELTAWTPAASRFLSDALSDGSACVPVAEDTEERERLVAVGVGVILHMQPTYWLHDGRLGYLQSFYTEPEWRSRGIGSEILRELLKWFDEQKVLHVNLYATSKESISFYERGGFGKGVDCAMWLRHIPPFRDGRRR